MKKSELFNLFAAIQVYYPSEKWAANPHDAVLDAWHEMFEPYPVEIVYAALKRHVVNSTYPPRISDLLTEIKLLAPVQGDGAAPTAEQAWALVLMAVKNSGYYAKQEFEKLPPDIQRRVGSYEVLRTWALAEDDGATLSVARANFLRNYGQDVQRQQMNEMLPESVKRLMQGSGDPVAELVERNTVDPSEPIPQPPTKEQAREAQANQFFDLAKKIAQKNREERKW